MLRFLTGWFCPYAQRSFIALEHSGLSYTYIEALKLQKDHTYSKDPELLKHNPEGLVPTIVNTDSGESVYDSLKTVKYLDELLAKEGSSCNFKADEYMSKAKQLNEEICSKFYVVLICQEPDVQKQAFSELFDAVKQFSKELEARNTVLWSDELSIVDISLFPWAYRFFTLQVYRGDEFDIFSLAKQHNLSGFLQWYEAMCSLPSVKATFVDREKLEQSYKRYATGEGKSKVGEAVRQGKPAHMV